MYKSTRLSDNTRLGRLKQWQIEWLELKMGGKLCATDIDGTSRAAEPSESQLTNQTRYSPHSDPSR